MFWGTDEIKNQISRTQMAPKDPVKAILYKHKTNTKQAQS